MVRGYREHFSNYMTLGLLKQNIKGTISFEKQMPPAIVVVRYIKILIVQTHEIQAM